MFGGACTRLALSRHLRNFSIGSLHSGTLANPAAYAWTSGIQCPRRFGIQQAAWKQGLPPPSISGSARLARRTAPDTDEIESGCRSVKNSYCSAQFAELEVSPILFQIYDDVKTDSNRQVSSSARRVHSASQVLGFVLSILDDVQNMFPPLSTLTFDRTTETGAMNITQSGSIKIGGTCAVRVNDTARFLITTTTPTSFSPTLQISPSSSPLRLASSTPTTFIQPTPTDTLPPAGVLHSRPSHIFSAVFEFFYPQPNPTHHDFNLHSTTIPSFRHNAPTPTQPAARFRRRLRCRQANSRPQIPFNILEYIGPHQARDACTASRAKALLDTIRLEQGPPAGNHPPLQLKTTNRHVRSRRFSATERHVAAETVNYIEYINATRAGCATEFKPPAGDFRVLNSKTVDLYFNLDGIYQRSGFQLMLGHFYKLPRCRQASPASSRSRRRLCLAFNGIVIPLFVMGSGRRQANPTLNTSIIEFPNNSRQGLSPLLPRRVAALISLYIPRASDTAGSGDGFGRKVNGMKPSFAHCHSPLSFQKLNTKTDFAAQLNPTGRLFGAYFGFVGLGRARQAKKRII
ncbi:hypothetical protein R3P38DRAFT_2764913 [Favolaschia claudopus]|uniref:Uncharacterized protein n=1 Tax=Favolaschia claudopus TaxID=2862362 RepID=A0AAW0DDD1_9AGAR